jgi:ubiquinone/menaquinone biosynthesis C-methylase UbiE
MTSGGKEKASQQAAELMAPYARWRSGSLGQITEALEQQLLVELLGPIAGKALLDVGCGDGALAAEIARRGADVTGLDPDPAMLAAARRRAENANVQLRLVEGKAESLPFPDAAFDCVLAVTALCFIPDAERAMAEMARALKPGGLLIIGELSSRSLWTAYRRMRGWLGHPRWRMARFRSPGELRRLVSQAGVDVARCAGPLIIPHAGRRRGCSRLSIPGSGDDRRWAQPLSSYPRRNHPSALSLARLLRACGARRRRRNRPAQTASISMIIGFFRHCSIGPCSSARRRGAVASPARPRARSRRRFQG